MRRPKFQNPYEIFEELKKEIPKRTLEPEFPFGLRDLDKKTHGLRRGKVHIIAARPSEAKTSLGVQTAFNLSDNNKVVAYVSLEDDRVQLVERLFCNIHRIDNSRLTRGEWDVEIEHKAESMGEILKNIKFLVLDGFGYNWHEFQMVLEKTDPKPDVIFLDYINMIEVSRSLSKRDTISEFVRAAKAWAIKASIAIVILAQINRSGADDRRPRLHHLKDSGTLEEIADLVLINYYPIRYDNKTFKREEAGSDYIEIEIAKNKNGQLGIVPARFLGKHYRFEDLD